MIAYEKLDVYQLSLDFVARSLKCIGGLPAGYAELRSQGKRAAFSLALHVAAGAGKTACCDKRRFYEIAKSSAMESAAICDIVHRAQVLSSAEHQRFKEILHRLISMLSKLCQRLSDQGTTDYGLRQGQR